MEKLIYITASSKAEAEMIAKTLVEERLVACANVYEGVTSFYWWQGKIEQDQECSIICKSKESLCDSITQRVKEIHSADCPCVVFLPIEGGNKDFLKWINQETAKPTKT
ncbi:MAG: divalent-cation tolerance protein CutA [Rhodospirillales bacterium]|nr:divalent-cation tolerance protein CutA [Rhodospirillales bacterium]